MICSVITAIISALFLCEIANTLPLDRKNKINYVIIACFAIGLGAVLTPLGEPLSTIAITKLQGAPLLMAPAMPSYISSISSAF